MCITLRQLNDYESVNKYGLIMGTAERKEREKLQRKKDIIDAAEKVFFSKGFENATMDDVAAEVELSKGTLYLYFNSKDELYHAIIERASKLMNSMFREAVDIDCNGLCKIRSLGEVFIKFYFEHPDYHDALMFDQSKETQINCICESEMAAWEFKKNSNQILVDAVKEGIKDGSLKKDIDPVMTSMLLWGQTMGIMQLAKHKGAILNNFYDIDPDDLINEYFNFVMMAIAA